TYGQVNKQQNNSCTPCIGISTSIISKQSENKETPLPWSQLSPVLAIRLAEPVTYTLVLPFIYEMVTSFDIAKTPKDVSFYAGLLTMSYSICNTMTTMIWGPLSDRIGRRKTILTALTGDLITFILFGLSKSFTWAIIARSLNGCFVGTSSVARSAIAEMADDSNRTRMMSLISLMWNFGIALGATIGGLLVNPVDQYPIIFGESILFKEYPYLLPCMVGSLSTAVGLIVGLFKLKETLVVEYNTNDTEETGNLQIVTESTPLVSPTDIAEISPKPLANLFTLSVIMKQVLCIIALMALGFGMGDQIYPIFAATTPSDGGLGFGTQEIGISLAISGIAVLYLLLVVYPRIEHKLGALKCYQIGLRTSIIYFIAIPFLSPLAAHIQQTLSKTANKYCCLWILLVSLVLIRIIGNIFSFTSTNILVTNIAPSKNSLGYINGLQELTINSMRAIGPLISGTLWACSIKHNYWYPFNYHLVWILCGVLLFAAWRKALKLPSSVNVFAAGRVTQSS
ncbi:MFS general substrate transporter, partial [Coemansia reversa NRRL 1564]